MTTLGTSHRNVLNALRVADRPVGPHTLGQELAWWDKLTGQRLAVLRVLAENCLIERPPAAHQYELAAGRLQPALGNAYRITDLGRTVVDHLNAGERVRVRTERGPWAPPCQETTEQ